jgi:hypothetical protein
MEQLTPYQAARQLEDRLRLEAWIDPVATIGSFKVRQMTPYHYIALELLGNAFVCGGVPDVTSLAEFLWILNNDYRKPQRLVKLRNWMFGRKLRKSFKKDIDQMLKDVHQYLEYTNFDQPMSQQDKKPKEPYTSWIATYVHILCSKYTLTPEQVVHMPIRQIFQLVRANQIENDVPMMNYLSEKAKQEMRK